MTDTRVRNINLRGVPEEKHRQIKVCAAQVGMNIKEFLLWLADEHAKQQTGGGTLTFNPTVTGKAATTTK